MRANAVAYLALFVALGGTSAWAADKITSKEIATNAVLSKHIKQVKTVDLANRVVTGAKLGNDAVGSSNVADNSLAATDILNGTIGPADLASGAVTTPNIADRAVTSAKIEDGAVTPAKLAEGVAGFTGYEFVEEIHNVNPGDTSIVVSAECPPGKKLLGGGFAVQDRKFNVMFANAQVNDVYALTAAVLPGQTITTTSQAFVQAICARINETP